MHSTDSACLQQYLGDALTEAELRQAVLAVDKIQAVPGAWEEFIILRNERIQDAPTHDRQLSPNGRHHFWFIAGKVADLFGESRERCEMAAFHALNRTRLVVTLETLLEFAAQMDAGRRLPEPERVEGKIVVGRGDNQQALKGRSTR